LPLPEQENGQSSRSGIILISPTPELDTLTPAPDQASQERVFPGGITISQVNAQLAADCESEPEFEARALSAGKRKRLEEEETFDDRAINLEATRDSVFIPNRLANALGGREDSEDNNGARRILPARKKSIYRSKHVRFSDE
jgi:hypothetical protein